LLAQLFLFALGTEARKHAFMATLEGETNATVSLHTQMASHNPDALRLALTTILRRKGPVLEAMTATLAALRQHLEPADQALLDQWTTVRTDQATLLLRGLDPRDSAAYRGEIATLDTRVQALEAQLSARSA